MVDLVGIEPTTSPATPGRAQLPPLGGGDQFLNRANGISILQLPFAAPRFGE